MNERTMRERLRKACDTAGSQRRWAAAHGMSAQYVSEVLSGTRTAGPKILDALGLVRTSRYEEPPPRRQAAAAE